jgi:hypothetical protein
VALGLVAGASVSVLAYFLAMYGPSGDSWSFRGNGALAALTAIPPILAAGWTALVLRSRSHPAWLALGLGAGAVGLVVAVADAALLPVFGPIGDQAAGGILLIALAAWTVVAPALATRFPSNPQPSHAVGLHGLAVAAWLVATFIGLFVVEIVLPAG